MRNGSDSTNLEHCMSLGTTAGGGKEAEPGNTQNEVTTCRLSPDSGIGERLFVRYLHKHRGEICVPPRYN